MTLGIRIKELREDINLTREELAEKLNVSYSAVSKYETDVRVPDKTMTNKIADILGCTTDYLYGRTDNKKVDILKYPETERFISLVKEEVERLGYDLSGKSREEIAKLIVKAMKIEEISKSD